MPEASREEGCSQANRSNSKQSNFPRGDCLVGRPCTGKSIFARWLRDQKGFEYSEMTRSRAGARPACSKDHGSLLLADRWPLEHFSKL